MKISIAQVISILVFSTFLTACKNDGVDDQIFTVLFNNFFKKNKGALIGKVT